MSAGAGRLLSLAHLTMITATPVEVVGAAAAAGFDAVGLRLVPTSHGVDHGVLGSHRSTVALRRAVQDSGLEVLDVEVIRVREPEKMTDPRPLMDAAAEIGASWVITTIEDHDEARRVETFSRLCADANQRGLGITLEYMVFSAVPNLTAALAVLEEVPGDNAAVLVDALHHERSGGEPGDVAAVPTRLVPYVQLCDASTRGAQPDPGLAREEAVLARLLPGDGSLPLPALLEALPETAALSVEAPLSGPDQPLDHRETARRAKDAVLLVTGAAR